MGSLQYGLRNKYGFFLSLVALFIRLTFDDAGQRHNIYFWLRRQSQSTLISLPHKGTRARALLLGRCNTGRNGLILAILGPQTRPDGLDLGV